MLVSALIDRVHYLLGQDPTASTNFVTDGQLLEWVNEGVKWLCREGKVLEEEVSVTTTGNQEYIELPSTTYTIGSTTYSAEMVNLIDVTYDNESLTPMKITDRGKLFTYGEDNTPQWYAEFNGKIYIRPIDATTFDLKIFFNAVPTGQLTAAKNIPLDEKHQPLLVNFCAMRGKQAYRQLEEAKVYLELIAAAIGMSAKEAAEKLGVKI